MVGKGFKEILGFWIEELVIRFEEMLVWVKFWGFFGIGFVWLVIRFDECVVWVEFSFLGVVSGSLFMIFVNFFFFSFGRGFVVGMFNRELVGGFLFLLLITVKVFEIRFSVGGWKERFLFSELSR